MGDTFQCYLVRKSGKDRIEAGLERRPLCELPEGDVTIRVAYSSLNYKDALAATGHPGVARRFPHVPGIDAAGVVCESQSSAFSPGDSVLVTSYELGVERWGGWGEYVRVPEDWVLPLPYGLSLAEAMILGTAGLTAGLGLQSLLDHGIRPEDGEIVVTGASGGVGQLAVGLLAAEGFRVVAVSGKSQLREALRARGASDVVDRADVLNDPKKPLAAARWAGAVDTVGGETLASLARAARPGSCLTACGLVGGADLPLTVYPFILRGVTLAGIDSAWCPAERRQTIWRKLASDWKPPDLASLARTIRLEDVPDAVRGMLAGESSGRTLIDLDAT